MNAKKNVAVARGACEQMELLVLSRCFVNDSRMGGGRGKKKKK